MLPKGCESAAAEAATVAVFYSISSTQPGLAGVDLGHFLISDVAKRITVSWQLSTAFMFELLLLVQYCSL
jgi:hypothetical protein